MEWPVLLLLLFGGLFVLMLTGLPVAFCFILISIAGAVLLWGGQDGLGQLIFSMFKSVSTFTLLPIPLFILMGEIMFRSGVASDMINAIDKWMGRLPGRLSLLAVISGTIIATLTGASMASVAMLGSILVPQMEQKGYKKSMILGPILGSGGLAVLIPPSNLAVLFGAIGEVSIGKTLIAIIMPGLLVACIYAAYIILRCNFQPQLAPSYEVQNFSFKEKVIDSAHYILPIGIVVFLVIGLMILGIATPTEAAATGTIGTIILAAIYKRLNWKLFRESFLSSVELTVMIFTIMVGAAAFSQLLAYSGASAALTELAVALPVAPIVIIIGMMIVVMILGCFMSVLPIMMITLPIFMPVVRTLGFDPIWFGALFLINSEMASLSPPFGLSLFVMRGVASKGTTMGDVYRAGSTFFGLDIIAMALILVFPPIALWLPSIMR